MAKYRTVRWKDQWGFGDAVVWLDVAKADAAWKRDADYYIPIGAPENHHRYREFGTWLLRANRVVWMPHVTLWRGQLSFTDGRHRFAWIRDHGADAMPVTTDPADAKKLSAKLGSAARITQILRLVS